MAKHAIMPSSLAKALIEAGVKHYDTGGTTQGGIGGFLTPQNQFQATAPSITTQPGLTPQINKLQQQSSDIYGQQQNLAQALLDRSKGQGPNPAAAALNNATGNNVANTAALIAGARGSNANPGLVAREAAQQGATTEQQAVGQGAALQAQQELAAQQELQGLLGNESSAALQGQGINQGALAAENSALTTGGLGASQINASAAQNNANNSSSTLGGLLGAGGALLGTIFFKGGKVHRFADGGIASYATPADPRVVLNVSPGVNEFAPLTSALGAIKKKAAAPLNPYTTQPLEDTAGTMGEAGGLAGLQGELASLGPAALMASSGAAVPTDFKAGGGVPGEAKVEGDSPENDTVPALLSPGEDVLPRSVTQAPDAPERAKRFVEALQERSGNSKGYGKVLKAKATLKDRVARLEKLCSGGMA